MTGPAQGSGGTYPTTYGAGTGEWFVENAVTGLFGNGAFPGVAYPGQTGLRLAEISDGLSNTVGFSEVKALAPLLNLNSQLSSSAAPTTPSDVITLGGTFSVAGAGVGWAYGATIHTGLTFVFPPNTVVPYTNPADGATYDVQWGSGGNINYAAVTARSYHTSGVNTLVMDGSVRFASNSIDQATWRALGARNGGEVVDGTKY